MTADTASLFFALLTVGANVALLGVVGLATVRTDGARQLRAELAEVALPVAFLVAATATAGSLYFSEGAHFVPCRLCWYQRIGMYPLAVVLAIAALRRDRGIAPYVAPVALGGAAISTYHYLLEWFPSLDTGGCDPAVPCTLIWFRRFGYMTLPYMALSAFLLVAALVVLAWRHRAPALEAPGATSPNPAEE